jgi:hypothetical protein
MMFLLRAAFWAGVVLVVLPTGASKLPPNATELGAVEAATAASAAVSDLSGFCSRQPGACATGSQIAVVLGHRMQAGAKMIYEFLTERGEAVAKRSGDGKPPHQVAAGRRASERPETTGSIAAQPAANAIPAALVPRPRPHRSQDTLTAGDRQPTWRGQRQEARLQQPG